MWRKRRRQDRHGEGSEEGYGLYRIYRLGLVDEAGDPLTLSGMGYRVTVTWNGMFAGEMKAYRIDGPDTVTEITLKSPLRLRAISIPTLSMFSTDVLNAPLRSPCRRPVTMGRQAERACRPDQS